MSLVLTFSNSEWGCVVSDGRANVLKNGALAISGDGLVKIVRVGTVGLLGLTGVGLADESWRSIFSMNTDFDSATRELRELLAMPDENDPEYQKLIAAGFPLPGAVLVGRDNGKIRSDSILGHSRTFSAGDVSISAIGNFELIADELRELPSRLERQRIDRASIPLLMRNLLLLASVRDFTRVSSCVFMREISAAPCDESAYADGDERKLFFLSYPGFSCRKIPAEMQGVLVALENVCCGNTGYHFGRIVLDPNASVEQALEVIRRHPVTILPPHRSTQPVQSEVIEKLSELAPDFGVTIGDTTKDVLRKAHAARGFAPLNLSAE